jgi:hypothetical protein
MAAIAEEVPEFRWWGYASGNNFEKLPESLRRSYMAPVWGRDYFRLLHRVKIMVNRHGEIARGFGNNLRQYEALGCGCLLLTDNLGEVPCGLSYESAGEAIEIIHNTLAVWDDWSERAREGQRWVLKNGAYENRTLTFLGVVENL